MRITTIGRGRVAHRRHGLHGLRLWWTFAAALVLGAAIIVAIVQNSDRVSLHYLAWHVDLSLIVVILATALIAVLLDEAGGLIWRRRRRSSLGRARELDRFHWRQQRTAAASPLEEPASPEVEHGASMGPAQPDI